MNTRYNPFDAEAQKRELVDLARRLLLAIPEDALLKDNQVEVRLSPRWRMVFVEGRSVSGREYPYQELSIDDAPMGLPASPGMSSEKMMLWLNGWTEGHLPQAQKAAARVLQEVPYEDLVKATRVIASAVSHQLSVRLSILHAKAEGLVEGIRSLEPYGLPPQPKEAAAPPDQPPTEESQPPAGEAPLPGAQCPQCEGKIGKTDCGVCQGTGLFRRPTGLHG